jgi:hypothetical protein
MQIGEGYPRQKGFCRLLQQYLYDIALPFPRDANTTLPIPIHAAYM